MKITLNELKQLIKKEIFKIKLNENKFEKAAKLGKGVHITVTYSLEKYLDDDDYNFDFDSIFNEIAKKYGGRETAGNSGFGWRDISFEFLEEKLGNKFIDDVKKYAIENKLKVKFRSIPLKKYYMLK